MLSTSWSICGIDTDGHDLTLSRLVAWGEAGELVPVSVASTLPPIAGAIDNLLVNDATTVTFEAADVRQPGFSITFEFAEPVELWGWRMAAPTQTGWPRMHAVKAGEHVQFLGQLEWQGIGELSAPSYSPVNFAQACGAFVSLPAAGSRSWHGVATHDGVTVYAAVYGGVIYKSTDGGATWVALSSGSRYWHSVATHDGVTLYAVVHAGVIYKSADGGETWAALSSGSRYWHGVATHDGVTVYAVESGGVIYKNISLPSIYNIDLRALTTSTPVTAGASPLEDATLAVEPVYTTIDLDVGGCGRIYGTVKRKADPQNIPLVRRVRLHDSRTGALLRQTWSQEDGSYEFRDLSPDLEFDVIAWDHEGQFRSTIANNLKPEVQP